MSSKKQIWDPTEYQTAAIGEAVSRLLYRKGGPIEVALFIDEVFGPLSINVFDPDDGSRIVVSQDGDQRVVDIKEL